MRAVNRLDGSIKSVHHSGQGHGDYFVAVIVTTHSYFFPRLKWFQ